MASKQYRYRGPLSAVTLNEGTAGQPVMREVPLVPDTVVELPESHDYVCTLIVLGHLVPEDAASDSGAGSTEAVGAAGSMASEPAATLAPKARR